MNPPCVTKEGIEVKIGQVWEDTDKRMGGRRCTVCSIATDSSRTRVGLRNVVGRVTYVALDRMHPGSTGWKLVTP